MRCASRRRSQPLYVRRGGGRAQALWGELSARGVEGADKMAPTILLRERGASRGSGGGAGAGGGGSHAERHALSMEGVRVPPGGAGVRRMSEPSSGAAPGEARRSQNGSNGGGGERVPVLPLAVHARPCAPPLPRSVP